MDRHSPRPEPLHGQTGLLPESARISLALLNQAPQRVEAERYRRAKGVLSVAVEACGCCLIGPDYSGRGESI
jgi:hypothetical protein